MTATVTTNIRGSSSTYTHENGHHFAKQPLGSRLSVQRDAIFNLLKQVQLIHDLKSNIFLHTLKNYFYC